MDTMTYFREIVTGTRRTEELAAFGGKVVGTFCNFVPEELILALGAVPVRLCSADHGAALTGETVLVRDVCPMVKSTAGMVSRAEGLYGRADLLVMPTPCDGKKKLGAVLGQFKPMHILDLPPRKDSPGSRAFWAEQMQALVTRLEALTGNRLKREALREALELLNARTEAFRRFHELRRRVPAPLSGQDAMFVMQASFTDDPARWTQQVHRLCDEVEAAPPRNPARQTRLLLTGAPLVWPNHKVIELCEGNGAVVVADEMCSGTQRLYQPSVLREWSLKAMLAATADKYLLPCTCPCFVEGADRVNRVLELAESHQTDGVVYHVLRLCALFDLESVGLARVLKERGVPLLTLSTDFSNEDTGQLRTRLEAFVEMVSSRPRVSA